MKNEKGVTPDFGRVAEAWEKWEERLEPCYRSLNDLLLKLAGVEAGQAVLDLGCGSGHPTFEEAEIVGPGGSVVALDISSAMLDVARRRAASRNIGNIQFRHQDIDSLPFEDGTFDSVTARFSLMFVQSPEKTLHEIYRVLRPGGHFAASVWARAHENPLPRSVILRYAQVPDDDSSVPGPFRFGKKHALPELMKAAGFTNITQDQRVVHERFLSGAQYIEHLLEASALWGALLLNLRPEQFKQASDALIAAVEAYRDGDYIDVPRTAWLISGIK